MKRYEGYYFKIYLFNGFIYLYVFVIVSGKNECRYKEVLSKIVYVEFGMSIL